MHDIQIINGPDGKPAFAVVPIAEYERLTAGLDEDALLIAAGNAARGDETFPAEVARRLVAGEMPLKVIREWRSLTQERLAYFSGVPVQYISQIERAARNVGRKTAMKLAPALKVSAEILLDNPITTRFAIGQRYRGKNNPTLVAEVVQLDEAEDGYRAFVQVRAESGTQRDEAWVVLAQFVGSWSLIDANDD